MKKFSIFLLICILLFSLVACGNTAEPVPEERDAPVPTEAPVAVENPTEAPVVSDHLPQTGEDLATALDNEYLQNLSQEAPVLVAFRIDLGGDMETAELTEVEDIAEFVKLFQQVVIASETQEMVTDNYNSITMSFADGATVSISLNLKNLEFGGASNYHIYVLDGFDDLWAFMNEKAE